MLQIELNLNSELEQQLLQIVKQQFQNSFEAFIKASLATTAAVYNLNPITINSAAQNKRTLHFNPPLILNPTINPDAPELITVEDKTLNIHTYAINRDILIEELTAELFLLWDEYAQELPENLTPKARQLRETLLKRCHLEE